MNWDSILAREAPKCVTVVWVGFGFWVRGVGCGVWGVGPKSKSPKAMKL